MDIRGLFSLSLFLVFSTIAAGTAQAQMCPTAGAANEYFWTDYITNSNNHILNSTGIHIKAGDTVFLDTSPSALRFLWIEGTLIFDPCHGVMDLPAAAILVDDGGSLLIGLQNLTYPKDASITLTTSKDPPSVSAGDYAIGLGIDSITDTGVRDALGARGLVVAGGTLILNGEDRGATWEKIDATVASSSTSMPTPISFTPEIGEEILLTPTDFDFQEGEVVELTQITPQLSWTGGLINGHYADSTPQDFTPTGLPDPDWYVTEQGEIALLSRNIVIQGEEDPNVTDSYGHVMIREARAERSPLNPDPIFRIEWAAFEDLGDYAAGGRYPLHVHQVGDLQGASTASFIRSSLIRDAYHHGIVVHNTEGIEVKDNVVHNVAGYGIYLQGAGTMNNTFQGNLVHGGSLAQNCCVVPGDVYAGFFVKNPNNDILENVATGFHDYGFYLVPSDEYDYGSAGLFKSNEVHSVSGIGFLQNTNAGTDDVVYEDLFAWKCREYGAWIRSLESYEIIDSVFADCRSGFYPASTGIRDAGEGDQLIENCLFVGVTANFDGDHAQETANFPNHDLKWDVLSGIEMYDGLVEVENCRFAEFEDVAMGGNDTYPEDYRLAAGLSQVAKFTTWSIDPRNTVKTLTFGKYVDRTVYFRLPLVGENQTAFTVINDTDGSLGYGSSVRLFPDVPFLATGSVGFEGDALNTPGLNGYAKPLSGDSWGQIVFAPDAVDNFNGGDVPTITIERIDDPGGLYTPSGNPWESDTVPISPLEGGNGEPRYPINLAVQKAIDVLTSGTLKYYRIDYGTEWNSQTAMPVDIELALRFTESEDDVVFLEIPLIEPVLPDLVDVFFESTQVLATSDLQTLLGLQTYDSAWFHDAANDILYLRVVAEIGSGHSVSLEGSQTRVLITQ